MLTKNCHTASDELRDEQRLGEDQSSPLEGDMVQDDTSLNATQSADQASVQGNTRLLSLEHVGFSLECQQC